MMQRRRNIRLIVVLVILIAMAIVLGLTRPSGNKLDVDREIFSYDDPTMINTVILQAPSYEDTLTFTNGVWLVNGMYKADPQRISVLFAILKQARVRRRAAAAQMDSLSQWMDDQAVRATFYEDGDDVMSYEVAGDISNGITYYREGPDEPVYLMEIPGYRSYLAGIYELDENGWRYPRVFDFNWSTLKDVEVFYPNKKNEGFTVSFKDNFFQIEELQKTDTTRITDFLDELSLLYVNDYLFPSEAESYDSLTVGLNSRIIVRDVGENSYMLEVMKPLPGNEEILVRIDSSEYAIANYETIRKLLRPRRYYMEKSNP